jgi:hypothetical protein
VDFSHRAQAFQLPRENCFLAFFALRICVPSMDSAKDIMAATVSEQIDTDVGKYTYFNPKLMEAIVTGDIYKTEDIKNAQQQWEIDR